jgi:carbon-monoxide dehydrogenase medium subunit
LKPGSFDYIAPTSLDEAIDCLARHGDDAAVLAGGQSLVPAMNLRLATPAVVVDVNRVPGRDRVRVDEDELVIDLLVRHRALERVAIADPLGRLLARTARLVGHLPIRVRGTFAGSLAHADPAAEWCMLAVALDAVVVARSRAGERRIPAASFFEGPFTTARAADELVVEVRLPLLGRAGASVQERSRTAGDFATVATVAVLRVLEGQITEARLAVAGAEGRPARAANAEAVLVGSAPQSATIAAAARAAAEETDPISDVTCSAEYRRHLVEVLMTRALEEARREALA